MEYKMPTISMFYGIIISMYYDDHNPPHFHAHFGEFEALFNFDGEVLKGDFPAGKKRIVAAWAEIHRDELAANWKLAKDGQTLYSIDPIK
jgi:hypothetical protein